MKKISEITRQKLKNYHKKYPINFWLGKKFSKKHLENEIIKINGISKIIL